MKVRRPQTVIGCWLRYAGVGQRQRHAPLSIPPGVAVTDWKNPILQGYDIGAGHSMDRTQRYDAVAGRGNTPRPQVSPAASNTGHHFLSASVRCHSHEIMIANGHRAVYLNTAFIRKTVGVATCILIAWWVKEPS